MTKTVWIYNEVEYDNYEEAKEVFYDDIHKAVRNRDYEFSEWFNDEYEGCDFDHCNYWSAWEVAEAMGVDFEDYEGDYAESIIDDAIEEVEKPCGYVFDLDGSDKIYDTEEEAGQAAKGYAINTFEDWLNCGRDTRIKLSTVLNGYLDDDQFQRLYECYEEQVLNYVREAESEDE